MYKTTMTYVDFDDNKRTEDFYFNLTQAEITKMELSTKGGLDSYIERISKEQDTPKIIQLFEDLICASYGVKSDDGKHFIKTKEALDLFKSTQAYSDLYMELATNADKASEFINAITPKAEATPQDHKSSEKVTPINK